MVTYEIFRKKSLMLIHDLPFLDFWTKKRPIFRREKLLREYYVLPPISEVKQSVSIENIW